MPSMETVHLPLRLKICAWCECPMGVEAPQHAAHSERPNHGLCSECTDQLIESLVEEPEPATPPARRRPSRRRVVRALLG